MIICPVSMKILICYMGILVEEHGDFDTLPRDRSRTCELGSFVHCNAIGSVGRKKGIEDLPTLIRVGWIDADARTVYA